MCIGDMYVFPCTYTCRYVCYSTNQDEFDDNVMWFVVVGTGISLIVHVGVVADVDSHTHSGCDHRKQYGVEQAIFPE